MYRFSMVIKEFRGLTSQKDYETTDNQLVAYKLIKNPKQYSLSKTEIERIVLKGLEGIPYFPDKLMELYIELTDEGVKLNPWEDQYYECQSTYAIQMLDREIDVTLCLY